MATSDAEVLIMGAGPVGLAMGCFLLRQGVRVRVLDQLTEPTLLSKAIIVHARTLEVLEDLGLSEAFLDLGRKLYAVNLFLERQKVMRQPMDWLKGQTRYPFFLTLAQYETERLLAEALARLGGRVERGVKLTGLTQCDEAVEVQLEHAGGGQERTTFPWVVGCGGAHSAVRYLLELPFEGTTYPEYWLLADVTVDGWQFRDDEQYDYLSRHGFLSVFPMPGDRHFRLIMQVPGVGPDAPLPEPDLALCQRLVDASGPGGLVLSRPQWISHFTIHHRLAPHFREGRLFLAGDAAHIHTPVGGQGMNTGIQDAFNLAWKLALALRGDARPELLDSYSQERHGNVERLLCGTHELTDVVILRRPLDLSLREHLRAAGGRLDVLSQRMGLALSQLQVHYRDSPAVGEDRDPMAAARLLWGAAAEDTGWVDLGHGPAPGERVPEVGLPAAAGGPRRLKDLLDPLGHTLLLFEGLSRAGEAGEAIERIRSEVGRRCPGLVRVVHVLTEGRPSADGEGAYLDAGGVLHRAFGAGRACLHLLRPDGYVGYRSQPPDWVRLLGHLRRLFTWKAVGGDRPPA